MGTSETKPELPNSGTTHIYRIYTPGISIYKIYTPGISILSLILYDIIDIN